MREEAKDDSEEWRNIFGELVVILKSKNLLNDCDTALALAVGK